MSEDIMSNGLPAEGLVTRTTTEAMARAKTPEEAAMLFKQACTEGLAQFVATCIDKAVSDNKVHTNAAAISGWEEHVLGASMSIDWARKDALTAHPVQIATSFAPRAIVRKGVRGGDISVGISIGGHF